MGGAPLEPAQNALYTDFNDTAPKLTNSTLDELCESRDRLRRQKGTDSFTQEAGYWISSPEDFLQTPGFVAQATKRAALSPRHAENFQTMLTPIGTAPAHGVPSPEADQHRPHLRED